MRKRIVTILLFAAILLLIGLGVTVFKDRQYNIISMGIAFVSCLPFFIMFERGNIRITEMILIAVMTALSVVGRFVFAPIPSFKPVTALTVITAVYFGPQAGFLTGSMTALLSNIYFGQGPWTPFQMLSWGIIGFLGGVLRKVLTEGRFWRVSMSLYGAFAGIAYSMLMDIWTVLSFDGGWDWLRYWTYVGTAVPVTVVYAVSNIVFLMLLAKPIGEKLARVKKKYGLGDRVRSGISPPS